MQTKNFTKNSNREDINRMIDKIIKTIEISEKSKLNKNNENIDKAMIKLQKMRSKETLGELDYKFLNVCAGIQPNSTLFFNKELYLCNLYNAVKQFKKSSQIVDFYCSDGFTTSAYDFDEIMKFSNGQLEYNHNYIQWLFPLQEYSEYDSLSPVLTNSDIEEISTDEIAKERLKKAFYKMLDFYGFTYKDNIIVKSPEFERKSHNWINKSGSTNHNYLRITRILRSLSLLGREDLSKAFYQALIDLKDEYNIPDRTWNFWKETQENYKDFDDIKDNEYKYEEEVDDKDLEIIEL